MRGALFNLLTDPTPLPERPAAPEVLNIPLDGHEPLVAEGDVVLRGQTVAKSTAPGLGDMHAGLAGKVEEVTAQMVAVRVEEGDQAEPLDFSGQSEEELAESLRRAGVNMLWPRKVRRVIINGVPPEPTVAITEQMLKHYRQTLAAGLDALRRTCGLIQVHLAALSGDAAHFGNCTVVHVSQEYPAGLDPLVVKAVTGNEYEPETAVVSLLDLYAVGKVMQTGRPVLEQPLTVAGKGMLAVVGTPVGHLLAQAGVQADPGDVVSLGGPLRGAALYSLDQGLPKGAYGLNVTPRDKRLPVRDAACVGCGECVPVCPSRIRPDLVSRASEFRLFDRARSLAVEACMECGLCGYVCPARRPLLQYILLAKEELAKQDLAKAEAEAAARQASGPSEEKA